MMPSRLQDLSMALGDSGFVHARDAARVVPLRSWTLDQKAWLAQRIHGVQESWRRRWGLQALALDDVAFIEASPSTHWFSFDASADSCERAEWGFAESSVTEAPSDTPQSRDSARQHIEQRLGIEIFADEERSWSATGISGTLARDVARKAFDAWLHEMGCCLEAIEKAPELLPAIVPHALNGRLHVRLPFGQVALQLRICGEHVHQLLRGMAADPSACMSLKEKRSTPTPVLQALEAHPVPLSVHLAQATLTLGELHALQPGDVITLEHKLSDPLEIHAPDGSLLGRAWLGQADGDVAVRLAAALSPTLRNDHFDLS